MADRGGRSERVEEVRSYYSRILPFYELETTGRSDLGLWRRLARRWKPRRILELGAGLGRVMAVLAREAPSVVGIDISFEMLSRASARLAATGPRLVGGDMRELPFARAFDLVIAPSDPFSHLTSSADRRAALRGVAKTLTPDGRFVLDALYWRSSASQRSRRLALPEGTLMVRESWRPLAKKDLWNARYRYRWRQEEGIREAEAEFTARSWNPATIRDLFDSCGLIIQHVWGTFSGGRFTRRSRRLIVVARPARFMQGRGDRARE